MRIGKRVKTTDAGVIKFTNMDAITSETVSKALGVRHYDLLKTVKKAEKRQLAMNDADRSLELQENCLLNQNERVSNKTAEINFHPIFKDWEYKDDRGRTQSCKIMNEDGVLALVKLIDTQEAYNYFAVLVSEFKKMKSERHIRNVSRDKSKRYTDELLILQEGLFEEGSKGAVGVIATMQRKIYNKATERSLPRGGVDHEALSAEEDFAIAKLRNGVADILESTMHLTAREARKEAYDYIKGFKETV